MRQSQVVRRAVFLRETLGSMFLAFFQLLEVPAFLAPGPSSIFKAHKETTLCLPSMVTSPSDPCQESPPLVRTLVTSWVLPGWSQIISPPQGHYLPSHLWSDSHIHPIWELGSRHLRGTYSASCLPSPAKDSAISSRCRQFHSHPCRPRHALHFPRVSPRTWYMQVLHQSLFLHSSERVDCMLLSIEMKSSTLSDWTREKAPLHLAPCCLWPCSLPPMMPQTTSQTRRFHTEHPQDPPLSKVSAICLVLCFYLKIYPQTWRYKLCSFHFPTTLQKEKKKKASR